MNRYNFEQWKSLLEIFMASEIGLHPDDLPDFDYYRFWSAGKTYKQAAKAAIRAAKNF